MVSSLLDSDNQSRNVRSNSQTIEFVKKPTLVRSSSLDKKFLDNMASNSLFKDIGS